jgi:hypothetical protein
MGNRPTYVSIGDLTNLDIKDMKNLTLADLKDYDLFCSKTDVNSV